MMPFAVRPLAEAQAHLISPGDTVKLAPLAGPDDEVEHSVFLEIWDPEGSQPPNSHPEAVETFLFLRGTGEAEVDGQVTTVRAGQFLVLAPGTVHKIRNTGPEKLYAITTMLPDQGFHKLVTDGAPAALDSADLEVLDSVFGDPR